MQFLDKTSIYISFSHPRVHFYKDGIEVEKNENCKLVEGWVTKAIRGTSVDLEDLVKIMRDSISRFLDVEGYRLDDCELMENINDSYVSFYSLFTKTQDAFNGADYVVIEFDGFYVNIGR